MDVLIAVLLALLVTGSVFGFVAYDKHVGKPKSRRKALEASLDTLSDHNVDIACKGQSSRIPQLKRREGGSTSSLSITDLLDRNAPINQKGDWKRLEFHEGLHQGPFDDELTDEEWEFVHRRYAEMLEQKTARRLTVQSHQRHLSDNERRMERLASSYMEEARRISEDQETPTRRWDQEFNS